MINDNLPRLLAQIYPLNQDVLKMILESIPANVFFKDTDCKYRMVSHVCEMLNGDTEDWTIIGKTDLEVQKDPKLGRFYYDDDRHILKTGKGNHYISEMVFNGEKYYFEIAKEPVTDSNGNIIGIVGLVNDITELKRLQDKLFIMSITDKLTGIYNRTYYEQKVQEFMGGRDSEVSVILCDTNGLKFFNDHFGHKKGDALLRQTVCLMKEVIGNNGEIMRIGGDEFFILCVNCPEEKCRNLVRELKHRERQCKMLGFPISNSYGYATLKGDHKDLESAISNAEQMMYHEKTSEKGAYLSQLKEMIHAGT